MQQRPLEGAVLAPQLSPLTPVRNPSGQENTQLLVPKSHREIMFQAAQYNLDGCSHGVRENT